MKAKNTKKTVKKTTRPAARKRMVTPREGGYSTREDFKTAALVVSATINVGVFVGWLALQVTNIYDVQVAQFLFVQ
jgi:hypothetical protein